VRRACIALTRTLRGKSIRVFKISYDSRILPERDAVCARSLAKSSQAFARLHVICCFVFNAGPNIAVHPEPSFFLHSRLVLHLLDFRIHNFGDVSLHNCRSCGPFFAGLPVYLEIRFKVACRRGAGLHNLDGLLGNAILGASAFGHFVWRSAPDADDNNFDFAADGDWLVLSYQAPSAISPRTHRNRDIHIDPAGRESDGDPKSVGIPHPALGLSQTWVVRNQRTYMDVRNLALGRGHVSGRPGRVDYAVGI
jgi:hypothetical protein